MKRPTHSEQIITSLTKIGRGTCGQIAQECRLSRQDIETKICALTRSGKVKVLLPKGGINLNGNAANIYCLTTPDNIEPEQSKLF